MSKNLWCPWEQSYRCFSVSFEIAVTLLCWPCVNCLFLTLFEPYYARSWPLFALLYVHAFANHCHHGVLLIALKQVGDSATFLLFWLVFLSSWFRSLPYAIACFVRTRPHTRLLKRASREPDYYLHPSTRFAFLILGVCDDKVCRIAAACGPQTRQ